MNWIHHAMIPSKNTRCRLTVTEEKNDERVNALCAIIDSW